MKPQAPAAEPQALVAQAWALLEPLTDPEIPVITLRELGVLREVRWGSNGLEVVITPTYSGCPAMGQMEDDIRQALADAGLKAQVTTQLSPAWSTDAMSASAHDKLRAYGIAPPHACTSAAGASTTHAAQASPRANTGTQVLQFAPRPNRTGTTASVNCPQCGGGNTTEISHFGSTACKALYKCLDCMEPFDYFKPY